MQLRRRQALLGSVALIGLPGQGILAPGGVPVATLDQGIAGYVSASGYVLPAAVPLRLMPTAAEAAPVHASWPGFAWGHLPAGSHLVATVGGQAVPVQQDLESRWPDGSVRAARVALQLPADFVAGQEVVLSVAPAAGAPNRTGWTTPTAMVAARDIVLQHHDGVSGTVATQTRLRDIVANAPRDAWGTNPSAGWEVLISGPVEVMIRAWAFRRAPGAWGGAFHRWIRDTIWFSARSDGTFEVAAQSEMSNWDRAATGGTLGDAAACKAWHGYTELLDGATLLYAWGGPNDARAGTVQASVFPTSGTVGARPAGYDEYVPFALAAGTGTLPGGLAAGTPYMVAESRLYAGPGSYNQQRGDGVARNVVPSSAGSGALSIVPLLRLNYGTALPLLGTDALPIRLGKARAPCGVAWDEEYMSRGARLWPRFEQPDRMARPSAATSGVAATSYRPGQRPWGSWLNETGDNPGDNRIGYLNHVAACTLLLPYDADYQQLARQNAAGWGNFMMWWRDPASGRVLVIDNGPDDVGGRYPQLGTSRPNTGMNYGGGDAYLGRYGGGTLDDWSGYYDGYSGSALDGSHMPCPWPVAAHVTGCPLFAEMGVAHAVAVQLYEGQASQPTVAGRRLYNVIGMSQQPRGAGWALRTWSYAEAFTPAAAPEAALIGHGLDTTAAFGTLVSAADAPTFPGFVLGVFWPQYNYGSSGNGTVQQYQNHIGGIALAMEAWRGHRPGMVALARKKAVFDVGIAAGTTYGLTNGYQIGLFNADNTLRFATMAALIAGTPAYVGGAGPYPATGFYVADQANGEDPGKAFQAYSIFQATNYAAIARAALAVYASAGVNSAAGDDALAAYVDLNRRLAAAPNADVKFSGPNYQNGNRQGFFPAFAIVRG